VGGAPLVNDGDGAIQFIEWLNKYYPDIPVLVVGVGSLERLEQRVLARNNASLWRLEPPGKRNVLAEALAGIAPRAPEPPTPANKRITINVGRESASYRVGNGRYEFLTSGQISYEKRTSLDKLMQKVDEMSPWIKGGTPVPNDAWYEAALANGQKLFDILIKDTIGTHLINLLQNPEPRDGDSPTLDLRFEIDLRLSDYVKLFKLPFEMVNHEDFDGVLCSCVPMARRVRGSEDTSESAPRLVPLAGGEPLRTLFIDATVSGDIRLRKYKKSTLSKTQTFGRLHMANEELKILQDCAAFLGEKRMAPVEVCSRDTIEGTGNSLYECLRAKISSGYDLVHFYGHSATLDDGATYLIMPSSDDTPLAVTVSEFAGWLRAGGCKMVVLSSCEGASALTALETMRRGVEGMLGFRWMVEEELCVKYFERFYEAYLKRGKTFCEAYRSACRQLLEVNDASPVWASALAVLRD
jgi:hypothetical protein